MNDNGDFAKMKVADLKKLLKRQGLAVTGNKTELIERLQAHTTTDNGHIDTSNVADDDDFDEEAILGDEEDIDLDKISPHEEESVLLGTTTIPMQSGKKKITLKRSEPCLSTSTVEEAPVEPEGDDSTPEEVLTPPIKKIKLSESEETQPQSKPDKVSLKLSESDDARKLARLARFGPTSVTSNKKINSQEPVDIDMLKKRAERFGEVTSKTLTNVGATEKMKQRQERFGEDTTKGVTSTTSTDSLDAKKAARAQRFAAA